MNQGRDVHITRVGAAPPDIQDRRLIAAVGQHGLLQQIVAVLLELRSVVAAHGTVRGAQAVGHLKALPRHIAKHENAVHEARAHEHIRTAYGGMCVQGVPPLFREQREMRGALPAPSRRATPEDPRLMLTVWDLRPAFLQDYGRAAGTSTEPLDAYAAAEGARQCGDLAPHAVAGLLDDAGVPRQRACC